ncbi:MAG: glycosyltransferase family 2 protein [Planctomycetes bacterium]|nr:glycosyltransferase family 2 protein [Planctomycetota bacterium]
MISAVVVNWNGRGYLDACLRALLAQTPPPDEVILVDNHSDDGSREFVAAQFPAVCIVDTGANLGAAGARNVGIARARGERVLCLDNDVELAPGALRALVTAMDDDPRCALVQVRSVVKDRPELLHYDAADLHYLGTLVLHGFFQPRATAPRWPAPVGAFVALGFLVRKDALLAVGGFDEELFILYEDNDVSWRLRMHGWNLRLAADALAVHAGGTAGLSFRSPGARYASRRAYLHARNRWLVLLRNARWRTLILTLPAQLLYAAVYLGFACTRGVGFATLRGNCAAFVAWPATLRRRRLIRGRSVPDRALLCALPMTANPGLADRGAAARLRRTLDAVFLAWFRLVRWACG